MRTKTRRQEGTPGTRKEGTADIHTPTGVKHVVDTRISPVAQCKAGSALRSNLGRRRGATCSRWQPLRASGTNHYVVATKLQAITPSYAAHSHSTPSLPISALTPVRSHLPLLSSALEDVPGYAGS